MTQLVLEMFTAKEEKMAEGMIERVGERLRKECLDVFGSTWNYDIAWRFARAAIEEMRDIEPTKEMMEAMWSLSFSNTSESFKTCWEAMIDAALKQEEKA